MDPVTIPNKNFQKLIAKRAQKLLKLASYATQVHVADKLLTRPFLGELLSQSVQLEELLDAYDSRNNCRWCSFRYLTAALKLFSDAGYELLHIQHSVPAYRLLPIKHDFIKATNQALAFTQDVLVKASSEMLSKAKQLGLSIPARIPGEETYAERLPAGRLMRDCATRKIETVSDTVTLLATAFLNLAAESERVHAAGRAKPKEYARYVSGSLSEENLRSLELRFHNLQSLYDTYVSGTEAEREDADLAVLRGHISVVFHLLKTATLFAHYYERHLRGQTCDLPAHQAPLVEPEALLAILMDYSVRFISDYIVCAERLCHNMLKRYIEIGEIEVPVPQYRGFHVRPSTLISKLVLHYGSDVQMQLDQETYDAGSPLELFRVNEKINARKRRLLAAEINRLVLVHDQTDGKDMADIIRGVILTLAERGEVILYEQPLQLPDNIATRPGQLLEQVIEEIGRLLAIGKIDIAIDEAFKVRFVGDTRVLADIKLLAESGYGEDSFGNNISLPKGLEYLRR